MTGLIDRLRLMVLALAVLGAGGMARGASIEVKAQISESRLTVGQQFVYVVEATIHDGGQYPPTPELPKFPDGLAVTRQDPPSQSLSQQIINMRASTRHTISIQCILTPHKEGTYQIPPARVVIGGRTHLSNAVSDIRVAKPSQEKLPKSLIDAGILPVRTESSQLNRQLEGRLFLRPTLSKSDPFEGETIRLTYEVYTDIDPQTNQVDDWLSSISGLHAPDFAVYELSNTQRVPGKRRPIFPARVVEIDGKIFRIIKVYEAYCVPEKPGTLTLGPFHVEARLPVRTNNQFDSFFGSIFDDNRAEAVMPSLPLEAQVKPLPPRPADFDNIIGDYDMTARIEPAAISEDELITLNLTLEGRGDVKAVGEPSMATLEDFDIFESVKSEAEFLGVEDVLRGRKTFEYVLRAKRPGTLTVPPIGFTVFNPWTEGFERVVSEALPVEVAPSTASPLVVEGASEDDEPAPGRNGIRRLADDLAYITTDSLSHGATGPPSYRDPMTLSIQALPLVLLAGAYALRRRRDRIEGDVAFARRRVARVVAGKRLRKAAKLCRAGQADAFYGELSAALRGFFGDKFNRPTAGLVIEEIVRELDSRGVGGDRVEAVRTLLERCDHARFTPGASEPEAMQAALDEAGGLITEMGRKV
jgi:hypothetical protein